MLYLISIISSLLLFIASPGQFFLAPVMWFALTPLFLATDRCGAKNAAKIGITCGLFYYTPLLYWILIVLGTYGNLSLFVSVPALLLLAMYMSLYLAVFCAAVAGTKRYLPTIAIAPPLWVGLDFIRGKLFTGFPWLDLGYSQYQNSTVIQLADIFGHHGVTFLIVLSNCIILALIKDRHSGKHICANGAAALALIFVVYFYGNSRIEFINKLINASPRFKTAIVQGNIDQSQKWLPELQEHTVNTYINLSKPLTTQNDLDLMIWPETALPFFPIDHPLFSQIKRFIMSEDGLFFITGAPHYEADNGTKKIRYFNSAFVISPLQMRGDNGQPSTASTRYDKQHLVPFGEYIPFSRFLPSSMPIVESMGNFSPGTSPKPISCHNAMIGVLICYESIFPDLARIEVYNGANLLVNLTNDAWYGKSSAPWQQLAMAVFRAVENRKSLARAANTGISCFIDPIGKVIAPSPLFEPYAEASDLPLLKGLSAFVRYGHLFPLFCLLVLIAVPIYIKTINNRKHP